MPEDVKDFRGAPALFAFYQDKVADIKGVYAKGTSFCIAGTHGCGKTTTLSNILKKATHKKFSSLYTTLTDIVSALTIAPSEAKFSARGELMGTDFLVIDEVDGRHMGNSENAFDLFGRSLESVIRSRIQNKLPTFLCSNSPNPIETFAGSIKESLSSLMTKIPLIPIIGPDVRKMDKVTQ